MSTQWRRQIMSFYYEENRFELPKGIWGPLRPADYTLRTGGPDECQDPVLQWHPVNHICVVETPFTSEVWGRWLGDCPKLLEGGMIALGGVFFPWGIWILWRTLKDRVDCWRISPGFLESVLWVFEYFGPTYLFAQEKKKQALLGISSFFFSTRSALPF